MTTLIWTLVWLLQVLPAASGLPAPVNVTLLSRNFHHMLKWAPGPGSPSGVYYHVEVAESSKMFATVAGCSDVQHPLVCNLTQAFPDPISSYFTQVTAHLDTQKSEPVNGPLFQPIKDTELDLPLLTVTPCDRHLCVDLHPPVEDLRNHYESFEYKLRIKCSNVEEEQNKKSLTRRVLQDLRPGTRCCVSVCFSDIVLQRKSNYSQPVCGVTLSSYNTDPLVSALLSLLVMFAVVAVVLLIATGHICLRRRPLPHILTSILHTDDALVLVLQSTSLASLLYVEPTVPSTDEKETNQKLSDESDAESESSDGEGNYQLRLAANLLSSSSSSSLLPSSAPLPPEPGPDLNSEPTSDRVGPQPVADTRSSGALSDARSKQPHPPADSLPGTEEEEEEEEEEVRDGGSQGVDLLTLTFGREVEEVVVVVEEKSQDESSASEDTAPVLSSQTWDMKEAASETVSCSVDEDEDEDEDSGYIGRPCTRDLNSLL